MGRMLAQLPLFCALAGGWAVLNGVLHDIFVLRQGRAYDRDLLRLLMDGHILITCGLLQAIASRGLVPGRLWGYPVAAVATVSLLAYCAMIFPFLKSFGMAAPNLALAALLLGGWLQR